MPPNKNQRPCPGAGDPSSTVFMFRSPSTLPFSCHARGHHRHARVRGGQLDRPVSCTLHNAFMQFLAIPKAQGMYMPSNLDRAPLFLSH